MTFDWIQSEWQLIKGIYLIGLKFYNENLPFFIICVSHVLFPFEFHVI